MKRRDFLEGLVLIGASAIIVPFTFEEIFAKSCNIRKAPKISKTFGKKDLCAKYARMASKLRFGKCYNWANAWIFAEKNFSVRKVDDMQNKHYNLWWINRFVEKKILKPGMIAGTFYSKSSWNNKFYDQYGKVFDKKGWELVDKEGNFFEGDLDELKKIEYTHLMCYAGKDCWGEHIFYHQFPYKKGILQKKIKFSDLIKNGLLIKEIIDEPRGDSEKNTLCIKYLKKKGRR